MLERVWDARVKGERHTFQYELMTLPYYRLLGLFGFSFSKKIERVKDTKTDF